MFENVNNKCLFDCWLAWIVQFVEFDYYFLQHKAVMDTCYGMKRADYTLFFPLKAKCLLFFYSFFS